MSATEKKAQNYYFRGLIVPSHLIESIDAYVETGRPTGGFLQACIDNDLREACSRADNDNLPIIPAIVAYLYNECDSGCWGFKGAHDQWVRDKQHDGAINSDG